MAQSVGAANLAAGLQDAYLGCSAVIALTGCQPPTFQHRHAYQEILHGEMYNPVTKYKVNVVTLEQLPLYLRQAFRAVTSGTPAPAHLDLSGIRGDVIEQARGQLDVVIEEAFAHYPSSRPAPEPAQVQRAIDALAHAARPVIVAGRGAIIASARDEIIQLAERLAIPVATSVSGKGLMPENHPLSVGVVGAYSRKCANQVVAAADLVVYIGSQVGDQVTHDWRIPKSGTQIIQIDIEPSELGRNYPNTVGVCGDAKIALRQMLGSASPRDNSSWVAQAREWVQDWENTYAPLKNSDAMPIRPERLCSEIARALPHNAILVSDTGYSAIWTSTMIPIMHATQTYLRAAGSLGWAFPAAIGAKCATPDRPVICFTGDGGFLYHLSELETARRYGINTVTIINNNSGFGQAIPGINRAYGDRQGDRQALYRFRDTNYAHIAQEFGCLGIRVEKPDEIASAIQQALSANQPSVVEVITDLNAVAPEPWSPT
jgi:acetolactate synthase-1/2/3 large subunit